MALFVFLLLTPLSSLVDASAPTPSLRLLTTDWRTGELEIAYENAISGYTIEVYAATHDSAGSYQKIDSFTASGSSGSHITSFLENGQSIWFYIALIGPDGSRISRSNTQKQTPPITAFIINWPDMLKDLDAMINNALINALKPSQQAQDDLKNALDGLKDAIGGNSANNAGKGLQDAVDNAQGGMRPPIVRDDGRGTYDGGNTGGKLPQDPTTGDGGLVYPNPDSGTPTELTMCLPYGVDMQGKLLKACIFTAEQMEKMKWLDVLRQLCGATIWIMFAIYLIQRFTPQLKV
ncbi:hypothetical protein [Paenibacillus sp. JCM 10914]|uniref:hypothetical protein n=1 Tax=Paenibacillus sp. JCM 10914 TaxID=1236974 RepID=UPI00055CBF2B|nr:hypothetical protein [Paenibacillus sp. JCM 10914]